MSWVYWEPKSRTRIFSAWMSAIEAAQCSGSPARWEAKSTLRLALQSDGFVVQRAAAAEVGGAGLGEHVGVAVLAQVPALGEKRDVAALARIVTNLNGQCSERRLHVADSAVRDAGSGARVHGDRGRCARLALRALRAMRMVRPQRHTTPAEM